MSRKEYFQGSVVMRRKCGGVIGFSLAVLLSACGKGVDLPLSTASESSYRPSLDRAWRDMSEGQREAFNWAVSDYSLEALHAKYPNTTPRMIISKEADAVIKSQAVLAARIADGLAEELPRIEKEEAALRAAQDAMKKIVVTDVSLRNVPYGFGDQEIVFTTKNGGSIGVSAAYWDAVVFINGEEQSDRHCRVFAYYKLGGGLASGKSMTETSRMDGDCSAWNTLEVKNAKTRKFRFDLDTSSVQNFAEKLAIPSLNSPTRSDFEDRAMSLKNRVENAMKAKSWVL